MIPPDTTLERTNAEFDTGTKQLTIRSFLSANAIRATDSLDGIDHCSSNNSTTCAVGSIRIPTLVMVMEASTLIRDGELSFERSAARDKDFVAIEGAVHGFTPCLPCEKTPGQYANSVRNLFDYVAAWINARY